MSRELNGTVGAGNERSFRWIALFAVVVGATLLAQSCSTTRPTDRKAAVEVGRYRLQSNPWVNLHQRLLYEACFEPSPPTKLSGGDLAKWNKCVDAYRS